MESFYNQEGTVTFLPERLNKFPVVLRGLTSDELIATFIAGLIIGAVIGVVIFVVVGKAYLIPSAMIAFTGVALFVTSTTLRRAKRNKPDTWFYRKIQWVAQFGWNFKLGKALIIRSGYWSIRRTNPFRALLLTQLQQLDESEVESFNESV